MTQQIVLNLEMINYGVNILKEFQKEHLSLSFYVA